MNAFLSLSVEERHSAYTQVEDAMKLQSFSVEKDLWVCWTLRELFTLPGIGEHLTFKGGTSLSKAWKLIQRFSEDIDLIVDKEVLGFGGDAAPDKAPSNKQRKARLESLMKSCREWVQGTLQPALAARLTDVLGPDGWKLEVDPDMPDGQCLLFHYPSVFPPNAAGYVPPQVKIELGARSDDWPHEEKSIQPYVLEHFPAFDPDGAFPVRVLAVERTFWEKACLLHEETFRPADKPRKLRMARHYYDFWCLLRAGVGERALANTALFQRVAEHREIFFRH
jgi:predicted nucleotidyltransferase component of viral defense system